MTKAVLWTAKDAETATGGKTTGNWSVTGISIDSRKVSKGDLFIALKGPNFDGHKFAQAALDAGASAVMVSDTNGITDTDKVLLVNDTMDALVRLGLAGRARRLRWRKYCPDLLTATAIVLRVVIPRFPRVRKSC